MKIKMKEVECRVEKILTLSFHSQCSNVVKLICMVDKVFLKQS